MISQVTCSIITLQSSEDQVWAELGFFKDSPPPMHICQTPGFLPMGCFLGQPHPAHYLGNQALRERPGETERRTKKLYHLHWAPSSRTQTFVPSIFQAESSRLEIRTHTLQLQFFQELTWSELKKCMVTITVPSPPPAPAPRQANIPTPQEVERPEQATRTLWPETWKQAWPLVIFLSGFYKPHSFWVKLDPCGPESFVQWERVCA